MSARGDATWPHALRALRHRDLRLFYAGQAVSLVGTWMQTAVQSWLVYRLTRSSELLGVVAFVANVPVFVLGAWAGTLADGHPRRRILLWTQLAALAQALLFALLTLAGVVRAWHVVLLAGALGVSNALEIPARQALLGEIAAEDTPNAIALNSLIVNFTRALGPVLGGWLLAAHGEGTCFALNALSFAGTIAALLAMRPASPALRLVPRAGSLGEGLGFAWRTPRVRAVLMLLGTASFFAMSYATVLPIFAAEVLHGSSRLFGILQGCHGLGAAVGAGLLLRLQGDAGLPRRIGVGASLLGGGLVVFALSRHPLLSGAALVVAGAGFMTHNAGIMTLLQTSAPPEMRGRVMGLYAMLFQGTMPLGSLALGLSARRLGAPAALLTGGAVVLAASAAFHLALSALERRAADVAPPRAAAVEEPGGERGAA